LLHLYFLFYQPRITKWTFLFCGKSLNGMGLRDRDKKNRLTSFSTGSHYSMLAKMPSALSLSPPTKNKQRLNAEYAKA